MIEFGSDFHYIEPQGCKSNTLMEFFPDANYYADGRQALIHLYKTQGWERLWVPEYFCYDVLESLKQAGLRLQLYVDYPCLYNDGDTLEEIQRKGLFNARDAILRVNYFGLRSYRNPERLNIPVVEDHTHDLIGSWAINSRADWCIASLRKSLPLPEGGILWSSKGLHLPEAPIVDEENEKIATTRWDAMQMKAAYLDGEKVDKSSFRAGFLETEEFFDRAEVCALDLVSREYLERFDVLEWYKKKKVNWQLLQDLKGEGFRVLMPEGYGCYPFSLVVEFISEYDRDRVRKALIDHQIYPAILWTIPSPGEGEVFKMSRGIVSIHCDGRYSEDDIRQMKVIIESILEP